MINRDIPLREKNIVFIGFMGAGKTTIGKLVAEKLDRQFIDTDEEIEKEFQMPVSEIFQQLGEKQFREKEKSLITKLSQEGPYVLSLGGGAFLQEEIREACLANCVVIYIHLPWESWKARIPLIIDSRPVLQGKSLPEIHELFQKRQEIYSHHHYKFDTENLDAEEASDQIVKTLFQMNKRLVVKNVVIGDGTPKICVPITGETISQIKEEATYLKTIEADLVEWRADFFEHVEDIVQVTKALEIIHEILAPTPIIFTFRNAREGGEKDISAESYAALNKAIIKTGLADIIDVELFSDEEIVKVLVHTAHINNVNVIISNHDFEKTPAKDEIIRRLCKAQELGGDIPKIAVMPVSSADVLTLLEATLTMYEQYAYRPIVTMSMAEKGAISRLSGGIFGSSITFGAAKKASAPGQIAVSDLRQILDILN